jgi:glycosyltransferase involved in cell wall biosynthesis
VSATHPELSLIIGGEHDVFMGRIMEAAKQMNLSRVHFPGRLTDESLAAHLKQAVCHVHPSSFEGFALPSLEALSFDCPTIVSDIQVMKEVLPKDGVFFFKNGDLNGMIAEIEKVLAHSEQAHAEAHRGGEEAKRNNDWDVTAKKTLDVLCLAQAQKKSHQKK